MGPAILPHLTQGWDAVQPVGISIFHCGFYVAGGSCLVYLYVCSLRLVYSVCQMVLSGVTALQVTRKQPGNAYRHPGLTWLPATAFLPVLTSFLLGATRKLGFPTLPAGSQRPQFLLL